MKRLRLFAALFTVMLLTAALAGCINNMLPDTITAGFCKELNTMLYDQYGIAVPASAMYVDGYYNNAFRDPCILLAFTVQETDFETMFSDAWNTDMPYTAPSDTEMTRLMPAVTFTGVYDSTKEMFTYLYYSAPANGIVSCVFRARHPTNSEIA